MATPVLTLVPAPASAAGAWGSFVSLDMELTLVFAGWVDRRAVPSADGPRMRDVKCLSVLVGCEMCPRVRPGRGPGADLRVGGPFASGARVVQPRGGRSTRYRTPACGGACRTTGETSLSTGVASRCGREVVVAATRSADAARAPRRAGPSVRPKLGSSASHGGGRGFLDRLVGSFERGLGGQRGRPAIVAEWRETGGLGGAP